MAKVGVPSGSPGKARLRLPSSIGDTRALAIAAGRLQAVMMMTRPWMSDGSSFCTSLQSPIWPSYSSPWVPDIRSTVGPLPFLMQVIGIAMLP